MPSGVYKRTELHREICRKGGLASPTTFKKGHKVLEETKEKMRKKLKGRIPWNKGTKGLMPDSWNKGLKLPQFSGKNHPMWGKHWSKDVKKRMSLAKGGTGKSKRYKHRTSLRIYKKWRKKVFERDNYTCQKCGITGIYITAHHIKSWAHYPKLRYKLTNGVTLCEDCHKLTDNYKGRGQHIKRKGK